jgi:hypothetical protein
LSEIVPFQADQKPLHEKQAVSQPGWGRFFSGKFLGNDRLPRFWVEACRQAANSLPQKRMSQDIFGVEPASKNVCHKTFEK